MTTPTLVLFDADKIKDYVFATGRLKEIRGASEQVRQLTDFDAVRQMSKLKALQPGMTEGIIYAGGGAGALLFAEADSARTFCREMERCYRQFTRSATLSAVAVPVPYADFPENPTLAEAMAQEQAALVLARRKASRPHAELLPSGGVLRFCSSDRIAPATTRVPTPDADAMKLTSTATAIKYQRNWEYRHHAHVMRRAFWQAFETLLPPADRAAWSQAVRGDQDLGNIGSQARPPGYVALVYADGDRIGMTQQQVVAEAGLVGYQVFSQALDYAAHQATGQALAQAYGSRPPHLQWDAETNQSRRFLPFEVITIGGDDVLLVCTAERGLEVACAISRLLPQLLQAWLAAQHAPVSIPALSVSVGVVIAHDSLPIVQLEQRGRELLANAKKQRGDGQGGIDFHIVTTPAMDAIATVRSRDYTVEQDRHLRLTRRPYRRDQAEVLLHYARALSGQEGAGARPVLPASKRAALYHACWSPRIQMMLDILNLHARLAPAGRDLLLRALHTLGSADPYPCTVPDAAGVYDTALPDLLEVMGFVAPEGHWQ